MSILETALESPVAMLDALLSPFTLYNWERFLERRKEIYYHQMTKSSILSEFRDVLDYGLDRTGIEEFRYTFDEFAVVSAYEPGYKVWGESQFATFIASRLRAEDDRRQISSNALPVGVSVADATSALWRSFYYAATYPFVTTSPPEAQGQQFVDLDAWTQAVALLATKASEYTGQNSGIGISLFDGITEWHNLCRFFSFSVLSSGRNDSVDHDDDDDDCYHFQAQPATWGSLNRRSPTALDYTTEVVLNLLPIPMTRRRHPSYDSIRPHVRKLVDESSASTMLANDVVIPYRDMVGLLSAVLQVHKDPGTEETEPQSSYVISLSNDLRYSTAIAKAILEASGIRENSAISLKKYLAFSTKLVWNSQGWYFSFDEEVGALWRALFRIRKDGAPAHSPIPSSPPGLPTFIVQAFNILWPFGQDQLGRRKRREAKLEYTTYCADSNCHLYDGVLKALTSGQYSGKIVVIYGIATTTGGDASVQDCNDSIFAVITTSPLWYNYKGGGGNDFRVGKKHFLLELAPKPRALWYNAYDALYTDVVKSTAAKMSFAHTIAAGVSSGGHRSSGLTIDFDAGVATMSSVPQQKRGSGSGYVEIPVIQQESPLQGVYIRPVQDGDWAREIDDARAWESAMHMKKVEVYSWGWGVAKDLTIKKTHV